MAPAALKEKSCLRGFSDVADALLRSLEGVSLPEKLQLKLVESKIFQSGCVALRYLKQRRAQIPWLTEYPLQLGKMVGNALKKAVSMD